MALQINSVLLSFLSLPGEMRNVVYAFALASDSTISIVMDSSHLYKMRAKDRNSAQYLETLGVLSRLNHQIRGEARSFFFANNKFAVEAIARIAQSPKIDYVSLYNGFLAWVGEDFRPYMKSLKFQVGSNNYWDKPALKNGQILLRLLSECLNLGVLYLYLDMAYLSGANHNTLATFIRGQDQLPSQCLSAFSKQLKGLSKLKTFRIYSILIPRWKFPNTGTIQRRQAHDFAWQLRTELRPVFDMIEIKATIL